MRIFVTLQLLLFMSAHQMPENELPVTADADYLQDGDGNLTQYQFIIEPLANSYFQPYHHEDTTCICCQMITRCVCILKRDTK